MGKELSKREQSLWWFLRRQRKQRSQDSVDLLIDENARVLADQNSVPVGEEEA